VTGFRILGPVEAWDGEQRLALGGARQVALFACLVLHANRAVSADVLSDALWGASRSGAGNRLQMAVARLRRSLEPLDDGGESVLRTVGGGYLLLVGNGVLDADVFAAGVREGRAVLDAGEPARASELLSGALGLWRGPVLAEVCFEDFAQGEIRHLEELRLLALEARVDADLQLGRHAQLVGELEALLAEQPSRERVACQLMLALYRSGRQADALEVYGRTRTYLAADLGLEPGPALKTLQAQILEHAASLAMSAGIDSAQLARPGATAPPAPPTPTIGRERELEDVSLLLGRADVRLVTLTGPGGVGKTRLALAVAHPLGLSSPDGVCWVELAGVSQSGDVGSTIARALAVAPLQGESAEGALRRYLASKELLLVIDNFEHVLGAAGLVAELLAACPGLTVLATSREALNVAAEHRVLVAPLAISAVPDEATLADIEATAASALFLAAARRRDSQFAASPESAYVIAGICVRLDGLPLALELAGARTGVLGVEELAADLDGALKELGAGPRDAPARQRTLTATIDWSYGLLDQQQQSAFAGFAVFAGGATLDGAQAVTGATLDTLEALIDKSLLDRRHPPDGTTRLAMLETVRQYALTQLANDLEHDTIHRRHLEQYIQIVEDNVARLWTGDERDALIVLDREIDNIHAALHWALSAEPFSALRLAGHLGEYWDIRPDLTGLQWLDAALDAAGKTAPPQDRARAQLLRSTELIMRRQSQAASDAANAALALYRRADDQAGISDALSALMALAGWLGDVDNERAFAEAACRHARLAGDDERLGWALAGLAPLLPAGERRSTFEQATELLAQSGSYRELAIAYAHAAYEALKRDEIVEALDLLASALTEADKLDNWTESAFIYCNLGLAKLFSGDLPGARDAFERELRLSAGRVFPVDASEGLAALAALMARTDRPEQTARLLGAARSLGYPWGDEQVIYDRLERDYFAPARSRYEPTAWRRAEEAGAALPLEQAISYALAELGSPL
jgi:predicted ATPase/DNA-binding SARP family transcriptional activator